MSRADRQNSAHDPSMHRIAHPTVPLIDAVRAVDPSMTAEKLPSAVHEFLAVRNLRREVWDAAPIDLQADAPLFAEPSLRIFTSRTEPEFQAAWRAFRDCTPITTDEKRKILAVWPSIDDEPRAGKEERPALRRIREQATLDGYLNPSERQILEAAFLDLPRLELLERRAAFQHLGLEWRERNGCEEPAKINSRYIHAAFPELSSRYFKELLEGLPAAKDSRTAELRRIYTAAHELSTLRETGSPEAAAEGWTRFLERDLYPKYGGGRSGNAAQKERD